MGFVVLYHLQHHVISFQFTSVLRIFLIRHLLWIRFEAFYYKICSKEIVFVLCVCICVREIAFLKLVWECVWELTLFLFCLINSLTLQAVLETNCFIFSLFSYKLCIYYRRLLHNIIVGDSKKFVFISLCVIFHVRICFTVCFAVISIWRKGLRHI